MLVVHVKQRRVIPEITSGSDGRDGAGALVVSVAFDLSGYLNLVGVLFRRQFHYPEEHLCLKKLLP